MPIVQAGVQRHTAQSAGSAPTLILGAGLAGLSCAYHLHGPATVLERENVVGGSARSVQRGNFTFDLTGHWLHFKDPEMRTWVEGLMGPTLARIHRRAGVYAYNVHTPYPFQAHTYGLPTHVVAECVLGFFAAREKKAGGAMPACVTFEDYIRQCLGDGIAEHFMLPYNTKLWTVHPREMAHAWCGRFVPLPKPEEVVLGALQPNGLGRALGYNSAFLYPRQGGIGQLAAALAGAVTHPVHLDTCVTQVDWQKRQITLKHGPIVPYQQLVSTLPLTHLLRCMRHIPDEVRRATAQLRSNQVTWWDVGLARPTPPHADHWTYYPHDDVPFFRVGCPSAVCPGLAPQNHTSLSVEVAHGPETSCPVSDAQIWAGLRRVGLVGAQEEPVLFVRSTLECAYTIMDHAYGAARQTVLSWLDAQGIFSVGRFGAWMYDSMEGALIAGRAVAERLNTHS